LIASPAARRIVVVAAVFFGLLTLVVADRVASALVPTSVSALCFLVAIAGGTGGRVRQFAGSVLGCALFAVSLVYLWAEVTGGPWISARRSEPSVLNAVAFFAVFGLPGLAYMVMARFGLRRSAR
jgi:hypothetical protein